jgi:hypothetical protein
VKNKIVIIIAIELNMYIALDSVDISTILIIPTYVEEISSH